MQSLSLLNEIYTYGYSAEILDVISLISILCGVLVIITKNPIVSVLFLIGLFMSIASFLSLLGLNFIGLSYLLVYVGAVSILFLFILMLINVRVSELFSNTRNSIPLAIIIIFLFSFPVRQILPHIAMFDYSTFIYSTSYNLNFDYSTNINSTDNNLSFYNLVLDSLFKLNSVVSDNRLIYYVTSNVWDGNLAETSHISSIGNIMYTSYSIWLILTSIILLLAMVGAIVITIKQKN